MVDPGAGTAGRRRGASDPPTPGEIGTRHPAALACAKIAVQVGKDLPLSQALRTDQLVAARRQLMMDSVSDVEEYRRSRSGGTNTGCRRSDT